MRGHAQQQFFHSLDQSARFAVMAELTDTQLAELLGGINEEETANLMLQMGAALQHRVMDCLPEASS